MKNFLLLMTMILTCGASFATTQCIQFPTVRGSSFTYGEYKPDWSTTWTDGFVAKGTSMCSNVVSASGAVGDPTWSSTNAADNKYCWCKLESPAVSAWVYEGSFTSAVECALYCSSNCGYCLQYISAFRTALFGAVQ